VALIEKGTVTKDNLDQYKVYAIDDSTLEIGCILSLYIDLMHYRRSGEIIIGSTSVEYQKSSNKELLKMYDPNFVKRITEK
jgi:adenine/guanine phosphoribosyltransferase-like PRPP-binding protein